jgi:hypothetical protein
MTKEDWPSSGSDCALVDRGKSLVERRFIKVMRKFVIIAVIVTCGVVSASAQNPSRKQYASDKVVSLQVDKIPATDEENAFPRTSFSYPLDDFKPGVVKVGPRTTYLKEGLRTDEVVRLLGKPTSISERKENDVIVTTYEFQRGEHQVLVAEFVSGKLVRSRTETRDEEVVQS